MDQEDGSGNVRLNDGLGAVLIDCIGVDDKKHVCEPSATVTQCGVVVKRKKLRKNDWKLFSCYPCTY